MKKELLAKFTDAQLLQIKQAEVERFRAIDSGRLVHRHYLRPVTVKILMLVDSGISFNQFYFGLSEVLDTLYANPEDFVQFDVTKAHRFLDPNKPAPGPAFDLYGPDFEGFRFNQGGFNLNDYDQLWIFGFNSGTAFPASLDANELEIVYKWMNEKKGGILAMGDHYNLGQALSGQIPRVRSMRKWSVADGVPTNTGPNRHDTLKKGHDFAATAAVDESNQYTFDDESDDVPMNIRLRWYYSHIFPAFNPSHWYWPYRWTMRPHPILCGKNGPINVLPDHPHEGEVVVPTNLTLKPQFNTYAFDEYPGGTIKPEIIAWAKVQDDHKSSDFKGVVNPKEFGAVGAYNGHAAGVGRVVVDSTWHHWFDVNLTGRMLFASDTPVPGPGAGGGLLDNTGDPRKLKGFNDTAAGVAALNKIRNYYRNTAIWLSPPNKIRAMNCVLFWNALYKYPLYADLNKDMPAWVIGHHAIEVLGKYIGACNVRALWPVFFDKIRLDRLFEEKALPDRLVHELDEFMIGGILKSLLNSREAFAIDRLILPGEKDLLKMIGDGIRIGFAELNEFAKLNEDTNKNTTGSLRELEAQFKALQL